MNVLLTCAGRRNYLIHYFRDALQGVGKVLAADSSPSAPALADADRAFLVPPIHDPGYINTILGICQSSSVGLVISLNDLELPLLARERERFLAIGATPVVSSPSVIETCFDKAKTAAFLTAAGIHGPRTYVTLDAAQAALVCGELTYPLVLKPRWGTASIGIEHASDNEELLLSYHLLRRRVKRSILADVSRTDISRSIIIQEKLVGEEYGLDVINDLDGRYVATCARRKLVMRAGETDRAITVADATLRQLGETIGGGLKHVGNLDCDVFVGPAGISVLELNPRFGGGYPFSHEAGIDLPAALLAWRRGHAPRQEWLEFTPSITAAKCDRLVKPQLV